MSAKFSAVLEKNILVVTESKDPAGYDVQWGEIEELANQIFLHLRGNSKVENLIVVAEASVGKWNSVELSILLRVHKRMKQLGGEMVLCGLSAQSKEVLKLTSLDQLWSIFDTVEAARAALGSSSTGQ